MMMGLVGVNEAYNDRCMEFAEVFSSEEKAIEMFGDLLSDDSTVAEIIGACVCALIGIPMDIMKTRASDLNLEGAINLDKAFDEAIDRLVKSGEIEIFENRIK